MARHWTPERVEAMRAMWEAGEMTAAQIAAALDKTLFTKNSVICLANRMGLSSRQRPPAAKPRVRAASDAVLRRNRSTRLPPASSKSKVSNVVPIKLPGPKRTVPIKASRPPRDGWTAYLSTRDGECKFIAEDGTSVFDKLCCGAPAFRPGGSFCEYHHALAYYRMGSLPNAPSGPDSVGVSDEESDEDQAA